VEAAAEEEAPAPAAPAASNKASMQWVVTAKMRSQLSKLGYSSAEVSALEPERAAAIIKHSISRPASGVPGSWKRSGRKASGSPMRSAVRAIGKPFAAMPATVLAPAAVLLLGGLGGSMIGKGKKSSKTVAAALSAPVAEPAPLPVSDELWLDRQIDKLIAVIKVLLGR